MRAGIFMAALASFFLASSGRADDDIASDFARLQSRVMTEQSEITARREQLRLLESRSTADGSSPIFLRGAACRDYRKHYRGGAAASPRIKRAEGLVSDVLAQIALANRLAIPSLCRAVVWPNAAPGAWAPDETPVVEPDETGQGQLEIQRQSLKTVLLTTGLLFKLDDDSELAALLGHELAHLILQYTRDTEAEILAAKRIGADWKDAKPAHFSLDMWVAGQRQAGELDADRLGAVLLKRAGYDPAGMTRLIGLLGQIESSAPKIKAPVGQFGSDAPNHPPARTRAAVFSKELPEVEALPARSRPVLHLREIQRLLAQP